MNHRRTTTAIVVSTCRALLFGCFALLLLFEPAGLLLPHASAQTTAETKPDNDERWEVIYLSDQRIGYSRSTTREIQQNGRPVLRSVNDTSLTIKRFGQTLKMQTILEIDETKNGDMLSYTFEMKNPPANPSRTVGRIQGMDLELETDIAGRKETKKLPWDPQVRSPAYQDRLLQDPPIKPGETRTFKSFLPEYNKVTEVKIAADEYRSAKLLDGQEHKLLKVRVTQSILPTLTVRLFLDEQGESLKSETDFLGTTMITYSVPKEEALKAIAGEELDIAVNTLVKVDRIRNAHSRKRAVYRITLDGDDPAKYLVSGPTQEIRKVSDGVVDLVVTAVPIPRGNSVVRTEAEYLDATQFLQCRDAGVVEHAERATAGEVDRARMAVKMERYVHDKLTKKNFSTALASAAEVAKNLEGDCTEHAVLLAAMLRAKKIPSRIAVGMVYVDQLSSFGGHMWTEAFLDGKWIPLDATLALGGIAADHIKLADSSFADDGPAPVTAFLPLLNILGKMQIAVRETE